MIDIVYAILVSIFLWISVALFLLKLLWNLVFPYQLLRESLRGSRPRPPVNVSCCGIVVALYLDLVLMLASILLILLTPPDWLPLEKALVVLLCLCLPVATYAHLFVVVLVVWLLGWLWK
jgi:hypothetical protein